VIKRVRGWVVVRLANHGSQCASKTIAATKSITGMMLHRKNPCPKGFIDALGSLMAITTEISYG